MFNKVKSIITEEINDLNSKQSILYETFESEMQKLKSFGYELIDKYIINNYIVFLLRLNDIYEIGLTTNENDFTTYGSQIKKPTEENPRTARSSANKIIDIVKKWIQKYPDIQVGSLNKNRTTKYYILFKKFGFNTSDIEYNQGYDMFPESWNFKINL